MKKEAELFKIFADPTRLKLAALLSIKEEICVCTLAQALNEPEYKISRHIGIMRAAKLVEARRRGTWMYYRMVAPSSHIEECLSHLFRECLTEHPEVIACLGRLDEAQCNDPGRTAKRRTGNCLADSPITGGTGKRENREH
ncbi:MAG: metalloregulator ArsR/SmtB family transcription factor [Syntrophobacterales bacterium]|nr:metalloregulator ArsR/SmtB family transcription factor [Syntrophobacterales bacterium]